MLGDFPKAITDAIMDSSDIHQELMMQLLSDPVQENGFARTIFEMLVRNSIDLE
jgi:type I restriction enzyme R subunit